MKLDYNSYYSSRDVDKHNKSGGIDDDGDEYDHIDHHDGENDIGHIENNHLEDNIKQSYNEMISDTNRVYHNHTPIDYDAEYDAKMNK
jgi:hypothetical protein